MKAKTVSMSKILALPDVLRHWSLRAGNPLPETIVPTADRHSRWIEKQ